MSLYDTLVYNGNEMTLAAWGIGLDGCVSERGNAKEDTFEFVIPSDNSTTASVFPFESFIKVYASRTSSDGSPNSFGGGIIKFQGYRVHEPRKTTGDDNDLHYKFEGPWYFLRQSQYLQTYKGTRTNPFNPGEVVLNTSTHTPSGNFIYISLGDQLQDILQWLLDQCKLQGIAAPYQYRGRALNPGVNPLSGITGYIDLSVSGTSGNYVYSVVTNPTIDTALFGLHLPSYVAKPMTVADALIKCLEISPRTSIGFDYSTSPPTIYIRSVDNFPSVSLPLFDNVDHESINITRRDDLLARAIIITYRITNTVNGQQSLDYAVDKWSAGGANAAQSGLLNPDGGLRVVSDTIDLAGITASTVQGHLDCEKLNLSGALTGASQAQKRVWWSSPRGGEHADFIDSRIRFQTIQNAPTSTNRVVILSGTTTIPDATIVYASAGFDSTGAPVAANQAVTAADLAFFTNRIVRGTHHAWMTLAVTNFGNTTSIPVKSVKVKITAKMQYVEYDVVVAGDTQGSLPVSETTANSTLDVYNSGTGNIQHAFNGKDVTVNMELTNGITGPYSALASETPAETYIVGAGGIAQYLYNALQVYQYESEYVKVESDFDSSLSVTNCLNFTNGISEWASMNAQVQSIREDWGTHETSIQTGVAKHLSAGQLSSLLNMWRNRRTWYNPIIRSDNAVADSGNTVDMAQTAGSANATPGPETKQSTSSIAYQTPSNPASTVQGEMSHDASVVASIYAAATTPVPVLSGAVNLPTYMIPRETLYCDSSGNKFYAITYRGGYYTHA